MKKQILLMMLALVIGSVNVSAQTKKAATAKKTTTTAVNKKKKAAKKTTSATKKTTRIKQTISKELNTEKNGYKWYLVRYGFENQGAESTNGNTLIPLSRGYELICFIPGETIIGCFTVLRNGKWGACDITGKEIIAPDKYDECMFMDLKDLGRVFIIVEINGVEGAYDINGKEIIPCRYKKIGYNIFHDCFYYETASGDQIDMDIKLDKFGRAYGKDLPSSYASQNSYSGSSSNSNSNSNSESKTTTVVVEHHREPVPVQEWQQCVACYGSGQCSFVQCGGSGWYYTGDRVTTCFRCNGSGKCTICAGKGGQYVTVYR